MPSAQALRTLRYHEGDANAKSPFLLGKLEAEGETAFIKYDDDRHIITVAGSRAGKGEGLIVPNLLTYRGSVVCIDPKGENASVTARWRAEELGQKVWVLDPFGVANVPDELRRTFNPLEYLDLASPELVEDVAALAEAMIVSTNSEDMHWDESARNFIKGVILTVLAGCGEETSARSFALVRDFLTVGLSTDPEKQASLEQLLDLMRRTENFDGAIAAAAAVMLDMGEKERGSVLSTARRNTEFLESTRIQQCLRGSGLALEELKQSPEGVTLYLVLPEWRFATHSRWLRLVLATLLQGLQRTPPARHPQTGAKLPSVLMILEEFASLGPMPGIEKAAGYIAGFGVKLWTVLQDLSQLKAHYPKSWETFIGNAGLFTAFGNVDVTTLEYLSQRLGEVEIRYLTEQSNTGTGGGRNMQSLGQTVAHVMNADNIAAALGNQGRSSSWNESRSVSEQVQKGRLMNPDEIARYFNRDRQMILVLIAGIKPIRLMRFKASADPFFIARADPNPMHA